VVVFANSRTDFGNLPAGAKEVRAKGGNTIPMVFVTTADGRKGIDAIPYTALKNDMRKSVRTLRTTLENVDVLNGGAEADSKTTEDDHPTTPAADQPEFTEWKNTAGRAIEAAAREVKGGKVLFLLPDGRTIWYDISNLSKESRKKLLPARAHR